MNAGAIFQDIKDDRQAIFDVSESNAKNLFIYRQSSFYTKTISLTPVN